MAKSARKWVGNVMNHKLVKVCAVCFAAAVLLKGCSMLEKVGTDPVVTGPVPDCIQNTTSNVTINDQAYTLTCK